LARRSLKPQLNQIRTWVRQGRTDAWIAHQLEVSVKDISNFKREHDLESGGNGDVETDLFGPRVDEEEVDLRAEDEALVAAALEEEEREAAEEGDADDEASEEDSESEAAKKRRRRGRRGGRGRKRGSKKPLEGTFDHGEDGYGLWLDPAIQDNPVYAEHWAGHRPVTVTVEADRIVIERAGDDGETQDVES
jgi:DNA-binding protein H-NS